MRRIRLFALMIGIFTFAADTAWLVQAQAPSADPEQQLRAVFQVTNVADGGAIVRAGSVVTIQKEGLRGLQVGTQISPTSSYWPNSYKSGGRISTSFLEEVNYAQLKPYSQTVPLGARAYITALQVKPGKVVFHLQTCEQARLRSSLAIQVKDSADLNALRKTISEVLSLDTGSSAESQTLAADGSQQDPLAGVYTVVKTGAQVDLNPDGSFVLRAADGKESPGSYTVNGSSLVLTYSATGRSSPTFTIQGDNILLNGSVAWVKRAGTSSAAPSPVVQPSFPAVYVSAQSAGDQLQLNKDKSFWLRESGQSYHGSFEVDGAKLRLKISETDATTEITLQNGGLLDAAGNKWILQQQKNN